MNQRRDTDLSRRQFFGSWGAFVAGGSLAGTMVRADDDSTKEGSEKEPLAISPESLVGAESVFGLNLTADERALMLPDVKRQRDQFFDRRKSVRLTNHDSPALRFDPRLPGRTLRVQENKIQLSSGSTANLPDTDDDIAFAPLTSLSAWIRNRDITSERLTKIYLRRLREFDPVLHCVVTFTEDLALKQARRADREIASGHYRGPLHGIPWGAKDLLETKGIRTSWGAMPYRDQIGEQAAFVVQKLEAAGAVLVAKLTLGALAMGDVWFNDVTRNPFNPEQGSSGSSAGSASATAAGLVGFSLGTETLGSIVSPCMRCGTTGLRPTFGRVARTGAMALSWSLDKIGPICRTVEDTALVLAAINGADRGDPSAIEHGFEYDGTQSLRGLKVGYSPEWFQGNNRDIERSALEAMRELGVELIEVSLPDEPYGLLYPILNVEAAAAFEELTLSGRDDLLVRQTAGSWPNQFRKSWFVPAVELVQADRFRRQVMESMSEMMNRVDVLFSPSFSGNLLIATNFTGHPSLTLRAGFRSDGTPSGVTLWGDLFEEGILCRLGMALERRLGVWGRRPEMKKQ
jgi:Asp-tRNA(Asn)/Glu-tRNA(Gln) amidotransferase A subunit family amidase